MAGKFEARLLRGVSCVGNRAEDELSRKKRRRGKEKIRRTREKDRVLSCGGILSGCQRDSNCISRRFLASFEIGAE